MLLHIDLDEADFIEALGVDRYAFDREVDTLTIKFLGYAAQFMRWAPRIIQRDGKLRDCPACWTALLA